MRNILLTIEYDGSSFYGWQRQPERRTVQGELERVLSLITDSDVALEGAGRTDRGVHARGQKASFRGEFGIPADRIPIAANNILSGKGKFATGDVRIIKAEDVPPEFHARFDCVGKTYKYVIRNAKDPDIMRRNYSYYVKIPLNINIMQEAARYLIGRQDFRAFMAAGGKEMESTVRNIYRVEIFGNPLMGPDKMLTAEITGDGFLYNMVRIIMGTLVDIGAGRMPGNSLPGIIAGLDRRNAGHTAPPGGLYLKKVFYDMEKMINEKELQEGAPK